MYSPPSCDLGITSPNNPSACKTSIFPFFLFCFIPHSLNLINGSCMLDMILLLHTTGEILIDRYGIVSDENNTDVMCYT
jgi:hypothetical protein